MSNTSVQTAVRDSWKYWYMNHRWKEQHHQVSNELLQSSWNNKCTTSTKTVFQKLGYQNICHFSLENKRCPTCKTQRNKIIKNYSIKSVTKKNPVLISFILQKNCTLSCLVEYCPDQTNSTELLYTRTSCSRVQNKNRQLWKVAPKIDKTGLQASLFCKYLYQILWVVLQTLTSCNTTYLHICLGTQENQTIPEHMSPPCLTGC